MSRTLFHYKIMSMDNISYDILSEGHYFMEDTILCYKHLGSSCIFSSFCVRVADLFSFLYCVFVFVFVRSVSLQNVADIHRILEIQIISLKTEFQINVCVLVLCSHMHDILDFNESGQQCVISKCGTKTCKTFNICFYYRCSFHQQFNS